MIAVFELFKRLCQGSVAEWSKALVLGTSHFGGVGSNPTTIKCVFPVEKTQKYDIITSSRKSSSC